MSPPSSMTPARTLPPGTTGHIALAAEPVMMLEYWRNPRRRATNSPAIG